jgi:Domain of unknown function (DUF4835)
MKKIFLFIFLIISFLDSKAQELDAKVTINTPSLANADKKVFEVLKQQLQEFLSNQKWTDDVFEKDERIKVNINLTITKELSATSFEAKMTIQASRPVYNSDYETTTFLCSDDKIDFSYEQNQPIQYSQAAFTDKLSAIFSYYAYFIIGMDYDSFSSLGGEPYFTRCQEIQRNVPQGVGGWSPGQETQNRYWLIENMMNPRMRPFREASYTYHRLALDTFAATPEESKNKFVQAMDEINKAAANYPNAMITFLFNAAKSNEIIEISKGMNRGQKAKIFEIMAKLDPSNMNKYQAIGVNF